jgi:hypothetical protein
MPRSPLKTTRAQPFASAQGEKAWKGAAGQQNAEATAAALKAAALHENLQVRSLSCETHELQRFLAKSVRA